MKYYRIQWTDAAGATHLSDPIEKWTDAELYRREVVAAGATFAAILTY